MVECELSEIVLSPECSVLQPLRCRVAVMSLVPLAVLCQDGDAVLVPIAW